MGDHHTSRGNFDSFPFLVIFFGRNQEALANQTIQSTDDLTYLINYKTNNLPHFSVTLGWNVNLLTIDNDMDLGKLTDGKPTTCVTTSPTFKQVQIAKITGTGSPMPTKYQVQIVTNGTNDYACTDLGLVNYRSPGSICHRFHPCVLITECMAQGFCNYECPCINGFCELYLLDKMKIKTAWQLCDILVKG